MVMCHCQTRQQTFVYVWIIKGTRFLHGSALQITYGIELLLQLETLAKGTLLIDCSRTIKKIVKEFLVQPDCQRD